MSVEGETGLNTGVDIKDILLRQFQQNLESFNRSRCFMPSLVLAFDACVDAGISVVALRKVSAEVSSPELFK